MFLDWLRGTLREDKEEDMEDWSFRARGRGPFCSGAASITCLEID